MLHLLRLLVKLFIIFLKITLLLLMPNVSPLWGFKIRNTKVVEILACIRRQSPSMLHLDFDATCFPGAGFVHSLVHLLHCLIVPPDDLLAAAYHLEHLVAFFFGKNLCFLSLQQHFLMLCENLFLVRIPLSILKFLFESLFAFKPDLLLLMLPSASLFSN